MDVTVIKMDTPHGLSERQVAHALGLAIVFQGLIVGIRPDIGEFVELATGEKPVVSDLHVQQACEVCACELWVGPKQMKLHQTQDMPLVCVLCQLIGSEFRTRIFEELSGVAGLGGGTAVAVPLGPDP